MKRLSDYTNSEAFELMSKISGDIAVIINAQFKDGDIRNPDVSTEEKSKKIVSNVFKYARKELERVLLTIDSTPITAANLYVRTLHLLHDAQTGGEVENFSNSSEQRAE